MILIQQSWWHIEDVLSPSNGKIYRKVIDFYTDENIIPIFLPNWFLSLKVLDKTSGHYLPFIEITYNFPKEEIPPNNVVMGVKLGDLSRFPSSMEFIDNQFYLMYHVRLEIEYMDPCPSFKKIFDFDFQEGFLIFNKTFLNKLNKFFNFFVKTDIFKNKPEMNICKKNQISSINLWKRPGFKSVIYCAGPLQPEYTIIVPRGMRLINDSKNIDLSISTKEENTKINFGKAHVLKTDGRESYNILAFEAFEIIKNLQTDNWQLKLSYNAVNKHKFYLIPIFAFLLLGIGLYVWLVNIQEVQTLISFLFTYIIVQTSYFTLYLTLRRDNYEIPFNSIIIPIILLSITILALIVLQH